MADTKISALAAVTTPDPTDEFAVNQSATSKKITGAQFFFTAGVFAPGSLTVADGHFMMMARHLILTGSQQLVLDGTAVLRIN
jgi:hypothetical protein